MGDYTVLDVLSLAVTRFSIVIVLVFLAASISVAIDRVVGQ